MGLGVIIGPILGGLLSDPVSSYPSVFGEKSLFGGEHGVYWLKHWPYALPNLMSAVFLFISAMGVVFGLEEVCERRQVFTSSRLTNLSDARSYTRPTRPGPPLRSPHRQRLSLPFPPQHSPLHRHQRGRPIGLPSKQLPA